MKICFHVAEMAQGKLCAHSTFCLFSNPLLEAQLTNGLFTFSTKTHIITKHLKASFQ
jgi:hypothetical protein